MAETPLIQRKKQAGTEGVRPLSNEIVKPRHALRFLVGVGVDGPVCRDGAVPAVDVKSPLRRPAHQGPRPVTFAGRGR
jgi:hypothetical protein